MARYRGETIGFLTAHAGDGVLHVAELAVCHDHQQRGIGSALLAAAVGEATIRRARAVTLTTFDDVPWNAPYYARLGFAKVAPGQLDLRLATILRGESDAGLPRRRRCAMSLAIAP